MCGIAGVVRHGGAVGADPAAALDAALAHRGPDGSGAWRSPEGDALLVHRRLAIIDPGPSGAQPMATPDGRHLLVFNGEIYNYRELRRSLEGRGEVFTTPAATPRCCCGLLACAGPDAPARLRGMFALAWQTQLFDGDATTFEGDVARLETRVYFGSQLLRDLDVMSMAHGLEVRVPFVDHQLLDAVWPDLGAHPSLMRGKRLLHETLARPLPPSAVDRPKQGFTLPFAKWMSGELQPFVRSGMAHLASSGWIAPAVPDETWRVWQSGVAHWSRPWALGVLGEFLRQM